jgi:hypothetical protein
MMAFSPPSSDWAFFQTEQARTEAGGTARPLMKAASRE